MEWQLRLLYQQVLKVLDFVSVIRSKLVQAPFPKLVASLVVASAFIFELTNLLCINL